MSDKNKTVQLAVAMTYGGVNYAPGVNTMPEAAAKSAIKRKLGVAADEQSGETVSEDFKPLPFEETMERFSEGDTAPEVFESLKFYQPMMAEAKKAGMTLGEFLAQDGETTDRNRGVLGKSSAETGLPENFPMRHVFEKLGFKSVEEVQAKSLEELTALDGIAEASATKALAYGK